MNVIIVCTRASARLCARVSPCFAVCGARVVRAACVVTVRIAIALHGLCVCAYEQYFLSLAAPKGLASLRQPGTQ